jgi:hypothetical protein
MANNVRIIWVFYILFAGVLATATEDKPTNNAADIYQNIFDRYPSREFKDAENKMDIALENISSKGGDSDQFIKLLAELKALPAWKLKETAEEYAKGKTPLTAQIESYIHEQNDVLVLIEKAAEIKTCNWPEVSDTTEIMIKKLYSRPGQMRDVCLLAIADARLAADKAQYQMSLKKTTDAFPMIYHAGNSYLIAHSLCMNMEQIVLDCLHDILGKMPADAVMLKSLEARLTNENSHFPSFRECLLGEKEFFAKIMLAESSDVIRSKYKKIDSNSIPENVRNYKQNNIEYNNQYIEQICRAIELPYAKSIMTMKEIEEHAVKDASVALDPKTGRIRIEDALKTTALFTTLFRSDFAQNYANHMNVKTQMHATLTAVKLYQIYTQKKQLPETLPQNCPIDLFSGKPFLYEIKKDGFILRSQGKDTGSQESIEYQFALHTTETPGKQN